MPRSEWRRRIRNSFRRKNDVSVVESDTLLSAVQWVTFWEGRIARQLGHMIPLSRGKYRQLASFNESPDLSGPNRKVDPALVTAKHVFHTAIELLVMYDALMLTPSAAERN